MKKRYIPFLACTLLSVPAQAALIAYDGFDYAAGALDGNNGGSGFSNAWNPSGGSTYSVDAAGLALSNLMVAGGRTEVSAAGGWAGSSRVQRMTTVSLAGQTYGSFLFRREVAFSNEWSNVGGVLIGSPDEGDNDQTAAVYANEWGQAVGSRVEADFGSTAGGYLTQGTTFIVLYSSNLAAGAQALNMWVLTDAQFDNFKAGGLDEMELSGASVGAGGSDVWAKSSVTGTTDPLQATDNVMLMVFGGADGFTASFDELRFGGSLDDVTPLVPEPSAALLGGLGLLALLRRRR